MYLVTGNFLIRQESLEQVKAIMAKIVEVGRTEAGIVRYTFYQDPADPLRFFLFEEWESKETHDDHFNSDFMQKTVPGMSDCLAGPPQVNYYDATLADTL